MKFRCNRTRVHTAVRIVAALGAVGLTVAPSGCSNDLDSTSAGSSSSLSAPPRQGFELVADAMQLHCGTLDCHGQLGRDMRLFGQFGLRLDPAFNPLTQPTSVAEYDASYASVVGLEPEAMSSVVRLEAPVDSLAMIRKARGIEGHKGGQLVIVGDPLDRCMVTWLVGPLDMAACSTVVGTPRPPPVAGL